MAKRKAESLTPGKPENGTKKAKHAEPTKINKQSLLDDSDASSDDESMGGVKLEEPGFKINEEYAKKFEHNSKRAELHRCTSIFCDLISPIDII
jgi:protein KRI1